MSEPIIVFGHQAVNRQFVLVDNRKKVYERDEQTEFVRPKTQVIFYEVKPNGRV